ncbi:MAG TPA: ABC transporter ATP-binding protein [Thermoanaerobaculia bacterium]|nr:ABC transporter ATP-binding protein [Thermoanaerobaculia bacterium]
MIEAHGISRRYGRRWALIDVSLSIPRGSTTLIAGSNGSGKSTLLRVLATAIRPTLGSATIKGHDLVSARQDVRESVNLLGHAAYSYDPLSALQNLQIAARFLEIESNETALRPLLARVGLEERRHDPVASFSAGMRKRLSIARVLLRTLPVTLLDEPYANLDAAGFTLIDDLISELHGRGSTVLVASHMIDRIAPICDGGVLLESGRIGWTGSVSAMAERIRSIPDATPPRTEQ